MCWIHREERALEEVVKVEEEEVVDPVEVDVEGGEGRRKWFRS